ncbi:MAG TPA: thiamine pyrophosphate-binding protein [Thermodesulfobacteriota bacterium]
MSGTRNGRGRTGGQLLVDCLRVQGVDIAFCVPGESYLPVIDALYDVRDALRLVVCRQEGGAAIMAEAHGKLTGRPGVCFVTRGPGATNASTGIHTAFQDSTPLVLFVGQVSRDVRDREGFQEVDFRAMFAPLAKWSAEVPDARRIPEYVHRAFQTALAGRPGPVVLALPEDVLSDVVEERLDLGLPARPLAAAPSATEVEGIADLVRRASRPLVIVGGGGWSQAAAGRLAAFAEAWDLPVAVSLRCQDYVDNAHPSYVGHLGIGAEPSLVARVKEADCLLVLGARLGEMTTAGYTILRPPRPGAVLVHVHPDPEELGRVYQADLPVNASPALVAAALADLTPAPERPWAAWARAARTEYEASLAPLPQPGGVDLGQVMATLRRRLPEDTVVCSGAGNYTGWVHRTWVFRRWRSQLAPTSGAMGYGVPAAVAASLVHPGRTVLSVNGDGCFLMHGQELATAAQYGARILFLVVNNGMYGTIRMHQERKYPGRVHGTALANPDFVALARAFGLSGERVEKTEQFEPALDRALAAPTSALVELVVDPEAISVRTTLSRLREQALARQHAGTQASG